MSLGPLLQLALLDELGVVDGSQFIVGGDPSRPEVSRPTGANPTLRDTGSPNALTGFFSNFVADTTEEIQSRTILLVVAGVIGIIGVFALARRLF